MSKVWQGKLVALIQPEIKELASGIQLDAKTQDDILQEQRSQWTQLEVAEVGEAVEFVKPGDKVYVPFDKLKYCSVINYGDGERIIIKQDDIFFKW